MQLQFDDPGWHKIDSAALSVHGELKTVVSEMGAVLNDEAVRALCSSLGILCAGFFFIDPIKEFTRFFDNERNEQDTYRTQYIWSDPQASEQWSDAVHRLFVQVRSAQREHAKEA